MEYSRDTKKSITPGLNPHVEESSLGALTILEQIITQVIEQVILKWNLRHYPTPDMSLIIRPVMPPMEFLPHIPISVTKLKCCLG